MNVGNVEATLGLDPSKFISGIKSSLGHLSELDKAVKFTMGSIGNEFNRISHSTRGFNIISEGASQALNLLGKTASGVGGPMGGLAQSIMGVSSAAGPAAIAIAAISAAVFTLKTFAQDAITSMEQFQSQAIGNAAMITSMQASQAKGAFDVGKEYAKNLAFTKEQQFVMEQIDARVAANATQLNLMNRELTKQGVIFDHNNEKQKEGFEALANALSIVTSGSPNKNIQFTQETKALLNGEFGRASNQLAQMVARTIGQSNAEAKKLMNTWKEQGIFLEKIGEAMVGFKAASGDIQSLWSTITSSFGTLYSQVVRMGMADFFTIAVQSMSQMNNYIREHRDMLATGIMRFWLATKGTIEVIYNIFIGAFVPILKVIGKLVLEIFNGWGGLLYVILPPITSMFMNLGRLIMNILAVGLEFAVVIKDTMLMMGGAILKAGLAIGKLLTGDLDGAKEAMADIVGKDFQNRLQASGKMMSGLFADMKNNWNALDTSKFFNEVGDRAVQWENGVVTQKNKATVPKVKPFVEHKVDKELKSQIDSAWEEAKNLQSKIDTSLAQLEKTELSSALEAVDNKYSAFFNKTYPKALASSKELRDEFNRLWNDNKISASVEVAEKDLKKLTDKNADVEVSLKELSATSETEMSKMDVAVGKAKIAAEKFVQPAKRLIDELRAKFGESVPSINTMIGKMNAEIDKVRANMQKEAEAKIFNDAKKKLEDTIKSLESENATFMELFNVTPDMVEFEKFMFNIGKDLEKSLGHSIGLEAQLSKIASLKLTNIGVGGAADYHQKVLKDENDAQLKWQQQNANAKFTSGQGVFDKNFRSNYTKQSALNSEIYDPTFVSRVDALVEAQTTLSKLSPQNTNEITALQGAIDQLYSDAEDRAAIKVEFDSKDAFDDIFSMTDTAKQGFQAAGQVLGDTLAEFAQTGHLNLKEFAANLLKTLQMLAAQKTAELLMLAAYHGMMALIAPNGIDAMDGRPHAAKAIASLQGAAVMGTFVLGSGLAGMAHDGMGYIPEDGTWLLQKGERVVDADTNKDLSSALKGGIGSGGISMTVNINNGDEQGVLKALPKLKQTIEDVVNMNISTGGSIQKTIVNYT